MICSSLCTPTCLAVSTDVFPDDQELTSRYSEVTYSLPVSLDTSSVLLRKTSSLHETISRMLREMVFQRLQQGFQIVLRKPTPEYQQNKPTTDVREILNNSSAGAGEPVSSQLSFPA